VAGVGLAAVLGIATPALARDPALDAGIDVLQELANDLDERLGDAMEEGDWSGARKVFRKWRNILRILQILRDSQREIVFGGVRGDTAVAQLRWADGSIHLREYLRELDPRIIAQHLAHEAGHLAHKDKKGTLDGEVLAWQKEAEVWTEFKRKAYRDGEPTLRDGQCDAVLVAVLRGEARLRGHLRRLYPKFNQTDPEESEVAD